MRRPDAGGGRKEGGLQRNLVWRDGEAEGGVELYRRTGLSVPSHCEALR